MKTRKTLLILIGLVTCSVLLSTGSLSTPAQAQTPIEWKMITSWVPQHAVVANQFIPFVKKVNERAAGKLKISFVGPEAVPPLEQLRPVSEGLFDGFFTTAAYHMGQISLGWGFDIFEATPKERRAYGIIKIVDEAYRKKANLTLLAAMADGVGFHLILRNKMLDKADLTGLKIRSTPGYDLWIKALGGAPTSVASAEVYSALEKGVVDGSCLGAVGTLELKLYEVAKVQVRPRFGDRTCSVFVNLNSWNKLPKDLQDLLTKTAIEAEEETRATMLGLLDIEEKELQKRGMNISVLPPKEAKKYLDAFHDRPFEELVLKPNPEFGPRFKEAVDRMIKMREK